MKQLKYLLFVFLAFVFLFSSCTIEKRLYRPGYFVSHTPSQTEPGKHDPNISEHITVAKTKVINPQKKEALVSLTDLTISERELGAEKVLAAFSIQNKKETISSLFQKSPAPAHYIRQKVSSVSSVQRKNLSTAGSHNRVRNGVANVLLAILVALALLGIGAVLAGAIGGAAGILVFLLFGIGALLLVIVSIIMTVLRN